MRRRQVGHGRDSGVSSIPAVVRNKSVTHSGLFSLRSLSSSNIMGSWSRKITLLCAQEHSPPTPITHSALSFSWFEASETECWWKQAQLKQPESLSHWKRKVHQGRNTRSQRRSSLFDPWVSFGDWLQKIHFNRSLATETVQRMQEIASWVWNT